MPQQRKRKKDGYGLGLLVLCLLYLGVGMLVIHGAFYSKPQTVLDHIRAALHTKGASVPLWKHPPQQIAAADLTPGCAAHDWGCVLGESAITEAYAQ